MIFSHVHVFDYFTELNAVDPELSRKINIGFPQLKPPSSQVRAERMAHIKKIQNDPELVKKDKEGTRKFNFSTVF